MRIIAGSLGGRRLRCPPGRGTRPTSDRVREALFSILGPPPDDARVLDLFAGAGTLGLEALSRGAALAVLVERDRTALRCLRENIETLGIKERCQVIVGDGLRELDRDGPAFDWVFLDPPYASDLADQALAKLARGARMRPDAVVVVEHDRRTTPVAPAPLEKTESRTYGDTTISLYRRAAS